MKPAERERGGPTTQDVLSYLPCLSRQRALLPYYHLFVERYWQCPFQNNATSLVNTCEPHHLAPFNVTRIIRFSAEGVEILGAHLSWSLNIPRRKFAIKIYI